MGAVRILRLEVRGVPPEVGPGAHRQEGPRLGAALRQERRPGPDRGLVFVCCFSPSARREAEAAALLVNGECAYSLPELDLKLLGRPL